MTCAAWDVDRSCLPPLPAEADEDYDAAVAAQNAATDAAVSVLYALSGRQFCVEEIVARPCPPSDSPRWSGSHNYDQTVVPYIPVYDRGRWYNLGCGCHGNCTETSARALHLPGPVAQIVTVTIEGVVLDPSEYTLEGDVLYRIGATWPPQDRGRPLGEPLTWAVTYLRGTPPPPITAVYAGQLAAEMKMACIDQKKCRLPRTVISTSRSGVTHVFDPSKMISSGYTGLSDVDQWLHAVNPNHLMQGPRVL